MGVGNEAGGIRAELHFRRLSQTEVGSVTLSERLRGVRRGWEASWEPRARIQVRC